MTQLNEESFLPLYAQLAERIEARIFDGSYPPESRIPSEHQLAEEFAVGRPTVRQATELLVRRGLLDRRRGSGTYVTRLSDAVDLFSLGGTIVSFSKQGLDLKTTLLEQPHATERDGQLGYHFARLGAVGEDPVLIEEFWLSQLAFPHFDQLPLEGKSLSRVVRERYGLSAVSADQTFAAVLASGSEAAALGLPSGSPILQVDRTLHFPNIRDGVVVRMLCRTDRYQFSQTIGDNHA